MKLALGTKNKLKIRALKQALMHLGIEGGIESFEVDSSVSEQPFGFSETIKGAENRADRALKLSSDASFGIGIENGLVKVSEIDEWYDVSCICIIEANGDKSYSFGSFYFIPDWMVDEVKKEKTNLGAIILSLGQDEKDPIGYFSSEKFKREETLTQAVTCALIKIIYKEKYKHN